MGRAALCTWRGRSAGSMDLRREACLEVHLPRLLLDRTDTCSSSGHCSKTSWRISLETNALAF